ncbi:MAG: aspartate aminotransferase family protein [Rhodothermales bacterium]|nr:aspartate aminotransferase family protein [Rhodothermales bacterium]
MQDRTTGISYAEKFKKHVAQTSDMPLGLRVARASGPFIFLDDGRRVIDLISGIAVSSLGHCHPEVVHAIREQAAKYLHVMVYGEFILQPQVLLATLLAAQLPEQLQVVYFTSSGTEAVEGALKLAKKATGRKRLVSFEQSYHGDTHGALSVTGRDVYKDPFLPLLPEVSIVPFNSEEGFESIDDSTAAVIVEPIQGEGGIRVANKKWLWSLREHCTRTGALLVFDEIQSGMGRTGELFAFQRYDVIPDILCTAKAFGGGMPLGAFVSSHDKMSVLARNPALSHVTTFGGHPVSCAGAHASLQVLLRDGLPARALELEERIRQRLRHPRVVEIRGMGAMLGMVLGDSELTAAVVDHCLKEGVLLGWTLHSDSLVRIAPPLNIPMSVLDDAIDVILHALDHTN